MAFDWPPNVQTKTKVRIAQILWTLWLDFEGQIKDSPDAVKELLDAMRGHGIDIPDSDIMGYRIILPHLDGGKYGHYVRRLVIGQRTKSIELVSELPDESHLPDGAGGYTVDDQIDRQLFAGITEPARGPRDSPDSQSPARGTARDIVRRSVKPAPGTGDIAHPEAPAPGTGDEVSQKPEPAPGAGDKVRYRTPAPGAGDVPERYPSGDIELVPARGPVRDSAQPSSEPARGIARDTSGNPGLDRELDELEDVHDFAANIRRLDADAEELFAPTAAVDISTGSHRELLDTIVGLVAELEDRLTVGVGQVEPEGRSDAEWNTLQAENSALASRLASVLRRAKDAEERLIQRNKENEGLGLQLRVLQTKYDRLEANNNALMRGERIPGQHLKGAQKFLAEVPSDRPEGGRNRRRRTTGSDSTLAYSVGPP